MPTKKGSVFNKLFTEYSENTRKIVKELGKSLVPPIKEAEFVHLHNELQRLLLQRRNEEDSAEIIYNQEKGQVAIADFDVLRRLLPKRKSKRRSLLLVSLFLFEFEGLYANIIDSFCLQLVMQGHDLFDPIRREYVSPFDEIGDVDIATKFKFLERHNLKMLVRREDQRLRNRIAHYDFSVDKHGKFSIGEKMVEIDSKLLNLMIFVMCVNLVIHQALKIALRKHKARMTKLERQLKTRT